MVLPGGRPLRGGSAARKWHLPYVGLQPVPAHLLGPLPQLKLEELGALLQHQVGARIVVHQRRSHTPLAARRCE